VLQNFLNFELLLILLLFILPGKFVSVEQLLSLKLLLTHNSGKKNLDAPFIFINGMYDGRLTTTRYPPIK
jgi:hypothetical protein